MDAGGASGSDRLFGSGYRGAVKAFGSAAVLVGVWLVSRVADACDCEFLQPLDAAAVASYDAVFEGTVRASWRERDDQVVSPKRYRMQFVVRRVWRGDVGPRVAVDTEDWRMGCGHALRVGRTYLVFAHRRTGRLYTGCSHTRRMKHASDELTVLGAGEVPRSEARCDVAGGRAGWVAVIVPLVLRRRRRVAG